MRRVPAILIVIFLAFPLLFAALATIGVSTWALDRSFYTSLVSDERLYQIPDAVSTATWLPDEISGFGGLPLPAAGRALREILPPAYLRAQAVSVVAQAFDFLEGRARVSDISVGLAPVKKALLGDPGKRFALRLAGDLPVGSAGGDFTVLPGRLPRSRPSTLSVERAAAIIQAGLPTFLKSIPDTARLGDNPSFVYVPVHWGWGPGFSAMGLLIFADIVLLLIAGGFWTAAAFIGAENRFERLQWFGWSLFVPAAAVFLMGLLINVSFISGWVQWGVGTARLDSHGFPPSFVAALIDVARRAMTRAGTGFMAAGAIAGGAALGLLAWSWSMTREERKGASE